MQNISLAYSNHYSENNYSRSTFCSVVVGLFGPNGHIFIDSYRYKQWATIAHSINRFYARHGQSQNLIYCKAN